MDKIISLIYKQFCESTGKTFNIKRMNKDEKELADWIIERNNIASRYKEFLYYNDVPVYSYGIVEINKSVFDTIRENETLVISPYASTMLLPNRVLLMPEDTPIVVDLDHMESDTINPEYTITHNPYSKESYSVLGSLHTYGYNICLGVFGKIYDKDIEAKIKLISSFNDKHVTTTVKYDIIDDNYLCIVKSNEKKLYKVKYKYR